MCVCVCACEKMSGWGDWVGEGVSKCMSEQMGK